MDLDPAPAESTTETVAVVLSGAAARGAFQAGALAESWFPPSTARGSSPRSGSARARAASTPPCGEREHISAQTSRANRCSRSGAG